MTNPSSPHRSQRKRRLVQPAVNDDVRRELDFHLAERTDELIDQGWSEADAEAEARRRFGDRQAIEQTCRTQERRRRNTQRRSDMFDVLAQDLRFTLRQLIQRPAFTIASLITLTLGIGAVSTMYTLVQGVLLHELPFRESTRLVNLWELSPTGNDIRVSKPNINDWTEESRSFQSIAFYSGWSGEEPVVTANGAINVETIEVSRDFFQVLGVDPLVGRTFTAEETQPGGTAAVLVSEQFWRDRLAAPPSLDGVEVRVRGEQAQVVGVIPTESLLPINTSVWHAAERSSDPSGRSAHNWAVLARLADGVSLSQARIEMNTIAAGIKATHGDDASSDAVTIRPIKEQLMGKSAKPLYFLFGASALVLLLAATNLATGLLARAIDRREEITLRSALGAGAGRLVRQLLTESVVLTTLGGILGSGFAFAALQVLQTIDSRIPRLDNVRVDGGVLLVTLGISALTGLIFGLIPALRAAKVDLRSAMSESRAGDTGRQRLWATMVASEVAIALVLLVGSLMLLSELWTLLSRNTGFEVEEVIALDIAVPNILVPDDFDPGLYAQVESRVAAFHDQFSQSLAALPGIAAAAVTSELPLRGTNTNGRICLVPRDCDGDEELQGYAGYRLVSPDFFGLLNVPILAGRGLSDSDHAAAEFVAVVNRTFAERYFPEGDAIGQQILSGGMDLHGAKPTRIVGVVGNILHRGVDEDPVREVYYPAAQRALRTRYSSYLVRAEPGALDAALNTIQDFIVREHPQLPPEVVTLEAVRVESLSERRFALFVLSALALVALGLALTGIWAVVTYRVTQRRREIGVRIALGLSRRGVFGLIFKDTAKLLIGGVLVGSALAISLTRTLRTQVDGLDGHPGVFLVSALILVIAGFAASWLPARRASATEPTIAMRS